MTIVERLLRYIAETGDVSRALPTRDLELAAEAARTLEIEGALYASLKRRGHASELSVAVLERLRRAHTENVAHNLTLLEAMRQILDALAQRGVPAAPLKGLMLLREGAIDNLGARACLDIDLISRRDDRAQVVAVLREAGFRTFGVDGAPKHLPPFRRGSVMVEVHETAFWCRSRRYGLDELEACEDPLSFTLVHLVHHLYVSSAVDGPLAAKTICDATWIWQFAQTRRRLIEEAQTLASAVGLQSELAHLLGVAAALCSARPTSAEGSELLALCNPASPETAARRTLEYYRRLLLEAPWGLRLAAVKGLLAPSRAAIEASHELPAGSWKVYPKYLLRPPQLAGSAVRMLVRALSSSRPRGRPRHEP